MASPAITPKLAASAPATAKPEKPGPSQAARLADAIASAIRDIESPPATDWVGRAVRAVLPGFGTSSAASATADARLNSGLAKAQGLLSEELLKTCHLTQGTPEKMRIDYANEVVRLLRTLDEARSTPVVASAARP